VLPYNIRNMKNRSLASELIGPAGESPRFRGGNERDVSKPNDESPNPNEGYLPRDRPRTKRRNHPSLKDMAADFIREGIVSGQLGPGAKVDQDEIAKDLGISRLPIREALIELTAKGFVTAIPHRGAFVVKLTVEDIDDHFEILGILFALAARKAAMKIGGAQLLDLRNLHHEIAATRDQSLRVDLDREFYRIINEAGSSVRLRLSLRYLWLSLPNDYYCSSPSWAATEAIHRERILAALEAHDPRAAVQMTEAHLRACAKVTIDELRSRGYWSDDMDVSYNVG